MARKLGPVRLVSALAPPFSRSKPEPQVPRGIFIIAAVLERQGFEVEVIDCQLAVDDFTRYDVGGMAEVILAGPRLVGISTMCENLPLVVAACEKAKAQDPEKTICLGGPGASFVAEDLLHAFPSIDVVVVGEGELTAAELFPRLCSPTWREGLEEVAGLVYRSANGEVVRTGPRPPLDLGRDAVTPAYDLAAIDRYVQVGVTTSRGCPCRCTFCSTRVFWPRRVRYRPVEDVLREVKALLRMGFGQAGTVLSFVDDLFPTSTKRVNEVCQAIKDEGLEFPWACNVRVDNVSDELLSTMREAGMVAAAMGIESGSDTVLRRIRKGFTLPEAMRALDTLRRHCRAVRNFFIWGFPFETPADLMQTLIATHRVGSTATERDSVVIGLASPLPGSELYDHHRNGLFLDPDLYFTYGGVGSSGFLRNPRIRSQVLGLIQDHPKLFSAFYSFAQPDLRRKLEMLSAARVYDRFYEGVKDA